MFQYISEIIVYGLFGLTVGSNLASSIQYFVYSIIKIPVLIITVIAIITFVRTMIKPGKLRGIMGKSRFGSGNMAASLFGAVTPFCSCSSIPLFIGFLEAKIPIGIAFSFLITSPLVNEVAFVIMGGLFGWKLAILYAFSGILLGVIGGMILGKMNMDKHIILKNTEGRELNSGMPKTFKKRVIFAFNNGLQTLKKLFPYIFAGVAIGSLIHGYVPQEFFENTIGKYNLLAVPIAVLAGVPIYAGCSMVAPLIFTITANGVPLGTSLAFMMSIAGLSLPEAIILKRVMTMKLLATFFGLVAIGIIAIGYLFNFLMA